MCFVSWQPAYHAPQISVYWCGRLFKGIRTAALLPLHRSSPSRLTARSYSLRWVWIVQLNTRLLWAIPLSVYLWRVVCSVLSCCTAAAGSLTDNPLLPTQINILPCPTAIHEVNKSDKKTCLLAVTSFYLSTCQWAQRGCEGEILVERKEAVVLALQARSWNFNFYTKSSSITEFLARLSFPAVMLVEGF